MTVKLHTIGSSIIVDSPYNAEFVAGARRLAGRWQDKRWVFPVEVKADVQRLLLSAYGEDGENAPEVVRLRVIHDNSIDTGTNASIVVGGRQVAWVYGRDSGARTGEGIVLRKGRVNSGGSMKNYRITMTAELEFDILRLPKVMADRMVADHPEFCRIVNDNGSEIDQDPTGENIVQLRAEG